MDRINMFFKMAICSLILIFYRSFYLLDGGISVLYQFFKEIPYWLDLTIFKLLAFISIIGNFILFYSLFNFFVECLKYLKVHNGKS